MYNVSCHYTPELKIKRRLIHYPICLGKKESKFQTLSNCASAESRTRHVMVSIRNEAAVANN